MSEYVESGYVETGYIEGDEIVNEQTCDLSSIETLIDEINTKIDDIKDDFITYKNIIKISSLNGLNSTIKDGTRVKLYDDLNVYRIVSSFNLRDIGKFHILYYLDSGFAVTQNQIEKIGV